jgi:hypothetical protein
MAVIGMAFSCEEASARETVAAARVAEDAGDGLGDGGDVSHDPHAPGHRRLGRGHHRHAHAGALPPRRRDRRGAERARLRRPVATPRATAERTTPSTARASTPCPSVAGSVPRGPDPDAHVAKLQEHVDAGFDGVFVGHIGPGHDEFVRFYAEEVVPQLQEPAGATAQEPCGRIRHRPSGHRDGMTASLQTPAPPGPEPVPSPPPIQDPPPVDDPPIEDPPVEGPGGPADDPVVLAAETGEGDGTEGPDAPDEPGPRPPGFPDPAGGDEERPGGR